MINPMSVILLSVFIIICSEEQDCRQSRMPLSVPHEQGQPMMLPDIGYAAMLYYLATTIDFIGVL